jgi:glutaredoxin-related protein
MNRSVLSESRIHPDALNKMVKNFPEIIQEVNLAIGKNKIVVVGMAQNPFVKKARKSLEKANLPYVYLPYGSYFSKWKERLAIKLWSGWPTYPQVFIDGKLIGGYVDLVKFLKKEA